MVPIPRSLLAALLGAAAASLPVAASGTEPVPSPTLSSAAFSKADRNADGRVDLEEFRRDIVQAWHALDLDGDGWITREEIQALPDASARRSLERMLRRADADGDSRLSFSEVVRYRMARFDAADVDRDDRLSLNELLAAETARRQARAAPRAGSAPR